MIEQQKALQFFALSLNFDAVALYRKEERVWKNGFPIVNHTLTLLLKKVTPPRFWAENLEL